MCPKQISTNQQGSSPIVRHELVGPTPQVTSINDYHLKVSLTWPIQERNGRGKIIINKKSTNKRWQTKN